MDTKLKKAQIPTCLKINGPEIEKKESFNYLGSYVTDRRSDTNIKCSRIGLARKTLWI